MFKIVNGYPCTSGCEAATARKGIDPRNPHNDPVKQAELDARDPMKAAKLAADAARQAVPDIAPSARIPGLGTLLDIRV